MVVFVAEEASVVVGESEANNVSIELARVLPSCVGQGLLKCDDRLPTITSLASWRPCVSEPKRRPWRASVGSGSSTARAERAVNFVFLFCLLLCGGALLLACAPCSALCARLGAVCAARHRVCGSHCVCAALCSVFFVASL